MALARLLFEMMNPRPRERDIIDHYHGKPIVAVVMINDERGQTRIRCTNDHVRRILSWHFSCSHTMGAAKLAPKEVADGYRIALPHTIDALVANRGMVRIHKINFYAYYEDM